MVADGDLVGGVARGQAEYQLKIPNAHADLHAVGVGLAVIGSLGKVHLGLLRGWAHGFSKLLRQVSGSGVGAKGGTRTPMDCSARS